MTGYEENGIKYFFLFLFVVLGTELRAILMLSNLLYH